MDIFVAFQRSLGAELSPGLRACSLDVVHASPTAAPASQHSSQASAFMRESRLKSLTLRPPSSIRRIFGAFSRGSCDGQMCSAARGPGENALRRRRIELGDAASSDCVERPSGGSLTT